jgi:hypothetical protein
LIYASIIKLIYFSIEKGDNETYYKEKAHINDLGVPMYYYEQTDGDGDWSGFIDWLDFLNNSDDEEFRTKLPEKVEIPSLLKNMVVESFMIAHDNLASGNNFYAYDLEGKKKWQIIEYDFDESFLYDSETHEPLDNPDIIQFFIDSDASEWNPLLARMLAIDEHKTMYLSYYRTFLDGVFGASSRQQPSERLSQLYKLILPWVTQDKLWQLSYGMTVDAFSNCAYESSKNFYARHRDVSEQLDSLHFKNVIAQ